MYPSSSDLILNFIFGSFRILFAVLVIRLDPISDIKLVLGKKRRIFVCSGSSNLPI